MYLPDLCPQPVTLEEVPTSIQLVRPALESVSNSGKEGILLQVLMSRGQASRGGGGGAAWGRTSLGSAETRSTRFRGQGSPGQTSRHQEWPP